MRPISVHVLLRILYPDVTTPVDEIQIEPADLLHLRAAEARMSLNLLKLSLDHSLLAHTNHGYSCSLKTFMDSTG